MNYLGNSFVQARRQPKVNFYRLKPILYSLYRPYKWRNRWTSPEDFHSIKVKYTNSQFMSWLGTCDVNEVLTNPFSLLLPYPKKPPQPPPIWNHFKASTGLLPRLPGSHQLIFHARFELGARWAYHEHLRYSWWDPGSKCLTWCRLSPPVETAWESICSGPERPNGKIMHKESKYKRHSPIYLPTFEATLVQSRGSFP